MAARKQIDGANAAAAGLLDNGVVDATVAGPILRQGRARLLRVDLPMQLTAATSVGRYFLARCGAHSAAERLDQWHIYLRRALFVCTATPGPDNDTTHCDLLIEPPDDAAYRWLYLIGIVPLVTGLMGSCPAYSILGMSTCKMKG